MAQEHFSFDELLKDAISQMTGIEPLVKERWVTLAFQETAIAPFKVIATFDSEETCNAFLRHMVPEDKRWRYRITLDKTVLVL